MNINIDLITDRFHGSVDDQMIDEMAQSIKDKGLINPITVHQVNGEYYLIAGRKRLLACKQLGMKEIECSLADGTNTAQEIREIQIHENLKRWNLPWYEQALLTKELHDIRQQEKPIVNPKGGGEGKTGWSIRDTAKELGQALGTVSEDISLAKAVLLDPSLKKIKDKKTAMRLIRQHVKIHNQEEETLIKKDTDIDQIILGDSNDILKYFHPGTFDTCITDPPWSKFAKDPSLVSDDTTDLVFREVYRVLKNNSFLYMFVGLDDWIYYRTLLNTIGFQVQNYPLIWHKTGSISHGHRNWEYQRNYELIMLAVKGNPSLISSIGLSSIYKFNVVHYSQLTHPNEKPVDLIEQIIIECTHAKAFILDPFAGSGSVGLACKSRNRNYVLIERDEERYNNMIKRFEDLK